MTREQDEIQKAKDGALNFVMGYLTALRCMAATNGERQSAADAMNAIEAVLQGAANAAVHDRTTDAA